MNTAYVLIVTLMALSVGRGVSAQNTTTTALQYSVQYGGTGGIAFSDCAAGLQNKGPISSILISSGSWIDGIQVGYGCTTASYRGGSGSVLKSAMLNPGEYIVAIKGRSGLFIDAFTFYTNKGRVLGPFGGTGGNEYTVTAPTGYGLRCIAGRSDRYLNAVIYGWAKI